MAKRTKTRRWLVWVALVVVLALGGWWFVVQRNQMAAQETAVNEVETAVVFIGDLEASATASGQVEGGMTQALGYGHCEEMAYDDTGNLVNDAIGPYHIYRADEMPCLKAILVQTNEPTGPFGAKAIAEIPKDGVAPAIANAVYDAIGVRLRRIPFTPNRVYAAMQANQP